MTERDLTSVLPPELIRRFFRGWTFEELHPMLGVCARWREIGLNHPVYWRTIVLNDRGVLLSLLRIERTHGRLFSLDVYAYTQELLAQVLPIISTYLGRLVALSLFIPGSFSADIFSALLQPAPNLQTFQIELYSLHSKALALPSDIFARHAPLLRTVNLYTTQISHPLAVFESVTDVGLAKGLFEDDFVVPCVFTHFPSVRNLRFSDCTALSQSQHAPVSFWSTLDSVAVVGDAECLASTLRDLPLSQVRNLQLFPGSSHIDLVRYDLRGDLSLDFSSDHMYDHARIFVLEFSERTSPRRRRFAEMWQDWDTDAWPTSDIIAFDLAERLVSLRISADILSPACALLPPMRNVTEVSILFHPWGFDEAKSLQPLLVPKLRSLRLRGHDGLPTVSRCLLRDICIHALSGYVPPLIVTAEQVVVPRYGDALDMIALFSG